MIQQDVAFLAAALEVPDSAVQRELLDAWPAVRACTLLAEGLEPGEVPHRIGPRAAAAAGNESSLDGAARAVARALEASPTITRRLVRALGAFGEALFSSGFHSSALPVLELVQRLANRGEMPEELLDSAFRHYLLLVRGIRPGAPTKELPFTLAMQARRARNREYIGAARYLEAERLMISGNLPAALLRAERLLPWAKRHGSVIVEGGAYNVLAAIHGRAGRFKEAAQWAARAIAPHFPGTYRYSALGLLGSAFGDLGMFAEARAAFELAAASPYGHVRRGALAGLIDILAAVGDRDGFVRLYQHLRDDPLLQSSARVSFLRDAGRAWATFGELQRAKADLAAAHDLAREIGMGLEILRTEDDLEQLARTPASPPVADPELSRAAHRVLSLRSERDLVVSGALP